MVTVTTVLVLVSNQTAIQDTTKGSLLPYTPPGTNNSIYDLGAVNSLWRNIYSEAYTFLNNGAVLAGIISNPSNQVTSTSGSDAMFASVYDTSLGYPRALTFGFNSISGISFFDPVLTLRGDLRKLQFQKIIESTGNSDLSNGLVGYWSFDEQFPSSTTTVVEDWSGNGHTGNFAGVGGSYVQGYFGSAFASNGSADIAIPYSSQLAITGAVTASCWVNLNNQNNQGFICEGAINTMWELFYEGGVPKWKVASGSVTLQGSSIPNNTWNHIVGTWDGTNTAKLYVNSVLVATLSAGASSVNTSGTFIGSLQFSSYILQGAIDDVRIYNRALSALDISSLFLYYQFTTPDRIRFVGGVPDKPYRIVDYEGNGISFYNLNTQASYFVVNGSGNVISPGTIINIQGSGNTYTLPSPNRGLSFLLANIATGTNTIATPSATAIIVNGTSATTFSLGALHNMSVWSDGSDWFGITS